MKKLVSASTQHQHPCNRRTSKAQLQHCPLASSILTAQLARSLRAIFLRSGSRTVECVRSTTLSGLLPCRSAGNRAADTALSACELGVVGVVTPLVLTRQAPTSSHQVPPNQSHPTRDQHGMQLQLYKDCAAGEWRDLR